MHEHAIAALAELLGEAGAEVVYLGAEQDPAQLAEAAERVDVDAILLSTHNGMALDYAQQLKHELRARHVDVPVVFGGVLNQKVEGQPLPVPVAAKLAELGFRPAVALPKLPFLLAPDLA